MLPHRAVAKRDLRLVPDMTYGGAIAAVRAHLAKRGFGDIEVNPSGGYNPTSTAADAAVIRAQMAVYKRAGLDPYLPSGHFGLGHGSGAHAPDEYFVIEASNPKVASWDGAVMSYVDYLHELATIA